MTAPTDGAAVPPAQGASIAVRGVTKRFATAKGDHHALGPIDIAVDSGGIQVQQNVAAPVRLRADSGGATIKLASNSGYDVRAKCDSCRIMVPKMTVSGNISPTHVEGKIRDGGPLVDVSVDSGNVTIE